MGAGFGYDFWLWPVLLAPFIGSFIGVIVTRLHNPASIVFGRSACPECGTRLKPSDLVPILSWLALRGRCRYCDKTISGFHLLIELAAIGVALWASAVVSGSLLWLSCLFGWSLLALAAADFRYFLLPDFLTMPLIAEGLLAAWVMEPANFGAHLVGAGFGFALVIAIRFVYRRIRHREGMGLGDAKLLAAAGAWVSLDGIGSVVLIGALTGLAFALFASARKHGITLTDRVPFGAFLALGLWIVWLHGPLVMG